MYFETLTFVGVLVGSVALLIGGTVLLSELCNKIKGKKEVEEPVEEAPYKLEPAEDHKCDCGGACGDDCKCKQEEQVWWKLADKPIPDDSIAAEPMATGIDTIELGIPEYVFINGGASSSNKYHKHPDSHGMDGAERMTKKAAEEAGYEPCSKCYK